MTKKDLTALLKSVPKDNRAAVACATIGHSRMMDAFFGEWYCGRCEAKVGDSLAGVFRAEGVAVKGHNCEHCRKATEGFTWKDRFLMPTPEDWIAPKQKPQPTSSQT